jgi:hypothetical protein
LGKRDFIVARNFVHQPVKPTSRTFTLDVSLPSPSPLLVLGRVSLLRLQHICCDQQIEQSTNISAATMSDAEQNATISDNEIDDLATPAEIEEVEAPRDTVEENGLDDDEDDLFGDGGDDEEEQPA